MSRFLASRRSWLSGLRVFTVLLFLALAVAACSSGGGGGGGGDGGDGGGDDGGGDDGGGDGGDGDDFADCDFTDVEAIKDPLVQYLWFLVNCGQKTFSDTAGTDGEDISVGDTYTNGNFGTNVKVAVVDEGLELAHDDLSANIQSGRSWDFVGLDTDPTNPATDGDHGTSVGGLIGAAVNDVGTAGVAPEAALVGYNFLLSSQTSTQWVQSLGGATGSPFDSTDVFVFNQSYGTGNIDEFAMDSAVESQMVDAVTNFRSGKGALYTKAAGNGFEAITGGNECNAALIVGVSCQNANMDPSNAVPWNIVVGALNAFGERSSYSTSGSAIWVSAPGGEYGYSEDLGWSSSYPEVFEPAMLTTDQSGCSRGYSNSADDPPNEFEDGDAENPDCDYTSTFNGTSSATPVTSGVIALLLGANPNLTWRDVKHILASTAEQVDPAEPGVTYGPDTGVIDGAYQVEQGWITNAAGHPFHNWYGFGRVDVASAIAMAQSYSAGQLGTFVDTGFTSSGSISQAIPDGTPTGTTHTINVASSYVIEAVQIKISITHLYIQDLGIELTSPSGTKSILLSAYNGFASSHLSGMVLLSNAFYGEPSAGNWTIKVVDAWSDISGTLTNWQIRIYGH
jgi:subtilisin family serine protease